MTNLCECRFLVDAHWDRVGVQRLRSGMRTVEAEQYICTVFGGFTKRETVGCWMDEGKHVYDPSIEYIIAIEPNRWLDFVNLAIDLAGGQDTVYVVNWRNEAQILDIYKEHKTVVKEAIAAK